MTILAKYSGNKNIAILSIAVLVIFSLGYIFEEKPFANDKFPDINPGSYIGEISNLFKDSPLVPLYIERSEQSEELLLLVNKIGWEPLILPLIPYPSSDRSKIFFAAIKTSGIDGELMFTGIQNSKSEYSGEVVNLETKTRGTWNVKSTETLSRPDDSADLVVWLNTKGELDNLEGKIKKTRDDIPKFSSEIEKLNNYILEGEKLKVNADRKYKEEKIRQEEITTRLNLSISTVEKLKRQYELAQKLTPHGRLVSLARETEQRENKWIEVAFNNSSIEMISPDIQEKIKKGEEILKIKMEIEREKSKIDELVGLQNPEEEGVY